MSESSCALCSLPLTDRFVENNAGEAFCCTGCRGVYDVLGDQAAHEMTESEVAVEARGLEDPQDGHTASFFAIDGMHCTTCESYIEITASRHEGVSDVQASYVSDTVRIDHDPKKLEKSELCDILTNLGYRAYERDDKNALERGKERKIIRLGAGLVFGGFVMFGYMMLIYPTYFGGRIYGEQATQLLIEGLYQGAANYLFITLGLLTSLVLFYTGGPILRGAYVSLRTRSPNMNLLITIAALSAFVYSWIEIYVGGTHIYFDVSVAIILIVTLGGEYETTIKKRAIGRLSNLTRTRVDRAVLVTDEGNTQTVNIDALEPGASVLVREGDRIPVDGTVTQGEGAVNEAVITGESLPVAKQEGDTVIGGSVVQKGSIVIAVGEDVRSSLDRINHLLWNLQSSTHGIQKLADKLATIFVPLVLFLSAGITSMYLIYWGADIPTALLVGLTVLIVSCPCAMGLATPLAVAAGVRDALERGIVIFDDSVFERLRDVEVVIFDKTGTLTTGQMSVLDASGPEDLFRQAAALEQRSTHPVATAISGEFGEESPVADGGIARGSMDDVPSQDYQISSFESYVNGVGGFVDGDEVLVGHPELFEAHGWSIPTEIESRIIGDRDSGNVPVIVGRGGEAEGVIVVGDRPRDDWASTLADLSSRGITTVVLTGDDERATNTFRDHSEVDHVFAGVPPEAKAEVVQRFGVDGQVVMVGDGTNDAPALASADLGIALGSGTAIAADAADVAIVDDRLSTVPKAFDLSKAAGKRVRQNIGWAFVYNGIAIPLAISGLLNPLLAAVAMGTSSVLVVANSSRKL